MTTVATPSDTFARDWVDWHRRHEAARADPHGFLAVTGLHWLTAEPQRLPDAPGVWSTGPRGVVVTLDAGEDLVVDGVPVRGEHVFGVIPERGGVTATAGDAVVEVARRGGHDIVRPRHPGNPLRVRYAGTPTFPPDPRWVAEGRYVPFDEPRPTTVGAAVPGLEHVYDAPGAVEFTLAGADLRLTAFPGHAPGSLFLLFTDATSGVTTYAANRSLALDPPDADGRVVLDFNRATNLPCAYTDLATCPLPPAENRLPIAVEAGERTPLERTGGPA
ncbi:DUF1684 domain-containing protein [Geodermatophilus sabuli]|uniref:DUF1684 domain-containing protein n=1 Tax=Geodermatophilus sabuli TaxID=1564158 RepID=A0A285EM66_9ACTN|nr:DUF1684 domain-containing protein [Geodermatophilus sabuli]MBB3083746.1 hypothetical protein [Geodermatophilus sabuli]SNX99176.1 hypothetical protein SAMN06893097_11550 [Geodermatophilus sabuli]